MEIIYAPFFGITIFAVFYIASRIINERALRQHRSGCRQSRSPLQGDHR